LDVEGTKVGPYTLDQIRGFIKDGEILARHKITAPHLGWQWTTVGEILEAETAHQAGRKPPLAEVRPFAPPPRPAQGQLLNRSADPSPTLSPSPERTDPAIDLFDVLQAARERKAALRQLPSAHDDSSDWFSRIQRRVPPQAWLVTSMTLVLGTFVWGMTRLFQGTPEIAPSTRIEEAAARSSTPSKPVPPPEMAAKPQAAPVSKPAESQGEPAVLKRGLAAAQRQPDRRAEEARRLEEARRAELERDREREREREREQEQERERERELAADRREESRRDDFHREEPKRDEPRKEDAPADVAPVPPPPSQSQQPPGEGDRQTPLD
jgi:hypothetical protein